MFFKTASNTTFKTVVLKYKCLRVNWGYFLNVCEECGGSMVKVKREKAKKGRYLS